MATRTIEITSEAYQARQAEVTSDDRVIGYDGATKAPLAFTMAQIGALLLKGGHILTADEQALLRLLEANPPFESGSALPADAAPDVVFLLEEQDGSNAPGLYVREDGSERPKTSTFTAFVTFASDGHGGAEWDRSPARGSETGLPGEVARIAVDAAGATMTMQVDADTGLPDGPGTLTFEITGVGAGNGYSFTPDLRQQDFDAQLDREINFRGTVEPGIVAGRAYKLVLTDTGNDVDYWTPTGSAWRRVNLGARGIQGVAGYTFVPVIDRSAGTLTWRVEQDTTAPSAPASYVIKGAKGDKGDPGASGSDAPGAGEWIGRTTANKLLVANSEEGAEPVTVIHEAFTSSVLRKVSLASQVTIATPADGTFNDSWTTIEEITVGAEEGGRIEIEADVEGKVREAGSDGGDRVNTELELVRVRGAVETVLPSKHVYGPRHGGGGGFGTDEFKEATDYVDEQMRWIGDAMVGDVFRVRAKHAKQKTSGRVLNVDYAAGNQNMLTLFRVSDSVFTTLLDAVSITFPSGNDAGQFVATTADVPTGGFLDVEIGNRSARCRAARLRAVTAAAAGDEPTNSTSLAFGGAVHETVHSDNRASDAEAVNPAITNKLMTPRGTDLAIRADVKPPALRGSTDRFAASDLPTGTQYAADVAGRLAPRPSAGDAGKVPAVNAAETDYELVDQAAASAGLDRDAVDARVTALTEKAGLLGTTLTDDEQTAFREKIDAAADNEWRLLQSALYTQAIAGALQPVRGVNIPVGTTRIRLRTNTEAPWSVVSWTAVLALPNVTQTQQASASNSVGYRTQYGDDFDEGSVAHNGNGLVWANEDVDEGTLTIEYEGPVQVRTADIEDDAVTQPKIADGAVGTQQLEDGSVTGAKLHGEEFTAADERKLGGIEAGAQVNVKPSYDVPASDPRGIEGTRPGGLTASDLKPYAPASGRKIETDDLTNSAVTEEKLGPGAVSETKLANAAVSTVVLQDGAVTGGKLDDNSVSTAKVVDATITPPKLDADDAAKKKALRDHIGAIDRGWRGWPLYETLPDASTFRIGDVVAVRSGGEAFLARAEAPTGAVGGTASRWRSFRDGQIVVPTSGGDSYLKHFGQLSARVPADRFELVTDSSGAAVEIRDDEAYLISAVSGRRTRTDGSTTGASGGFQDEIDRQYGMVKTGLILGKTLLDALPEVTPYVTAPDKDGGDMNSFKLELPGDATLHVARAAERYFAVSNSRASNAADDAVWLMIEAVPVILDLETDFVGLSTALNSHLYAAPRAGTDGNPATWELDRAYIFNLLGVGNAHNPRPVTGALARGRFARQWTQIAAATTTAKFTGSNPTGPRIYDPDTVGPVFGLGNLTSAHQVGLSLNDVSPWRAGGGGYGQLARLHRAPTAVQTISPNFNNSGHVVAQFTVAVTDGDICQLEGRMHSTGSGDESYFLSPPFSGRWLGFWNATRHSTQGTALVLSGNHQSGFSLGEWHGFANNISIGFATGRLLTIQADATETTYTTELKLIKL